MLGFIVGLVVVGALVIVGINVAVIVTTKDDIVTREQAMLEAKDKPSDAIVVLGASVFADGTPSNILQDRLDDGIALYFAGVAPKIIMSGDSGTLEYDEVGSMKDYAIGQGVPSGDVFCDHAGFSTYESMYRAKNVFNAQRIVVATQTYHLYRALYSAQGLGMQALGVPSDYREYANQNHYDLREVPARVQDFFKTLFNVPSKYVGDPISLNQSGDVTNGDQ